MNSIDPVTMRAPRICPACGAGVSDDAPSGHCPRCLLQVALDFGNAPPAGVVQTRGAHRTAQRNPLPLCFGDYELLEELGRGGMGVVYRARQISLSRLVALKMMAAGQLASPGAIQRFQLEARAAAQLDHPNIVPIYEVGNEGGEHYFTMKLIEGGSLADQLGKVGTNATLPPAHFPTRPPAAERRPDNLDYCTEQDLARLMAQVARAVHYAHQHGVLHRDLKPTNILLDHSGQPHLTDFGLAKLLEEGSELTRSQEMLGSPNYMAPEQAAGNARRLTTAADVYGLGAILYKLLTGRAPFLAETPLATLHQVLHGELIRPRQFNPQVAPDLETICLKCLALEPAGRYSSALAVAEELERFLRDEPILARPVSKTEKLLRWCRRKPALASLAAAVVLLAVTVIFASALATWRIAAARNREQGERYRAQLALTRLEIQRANDLFEADNTAAAVASLASVLRNDPSNRIAAERLLSALTCRNFAFPLRENDSRNGPGDHPRPAPHTSRPEAETIEAALRQANWGQMNQTSPDGRWMAKASETTASIYDTVTGQLVGGPLVHSNTILAIQFSPDGQRLATAGFDSAARLWETRTTKAIGSAMPHRDVVYGAVFSPDGLWLATASKDRTARVWDTRTGQGVGEPLRHQNKVYTIQFSPDGLQVVTASKDFTARVWDARTGAPLTEPLRHHMEVHFAQFTSDGRRVVTFCRDNSSRIWDVRAGSATPVELKHLSPVHACGFAVDGRRIVTGSADETAQIWDSATGQPLGGPFKNGNDVLHAEFSPDGLWLVTASYDTAARLWSPGDSGATFRQLPHNGQVTAAHFNTDSTKVVTASWDHTARVWDVRTGQPLTPPLQHDQKVTDAHFSRDGLKVVTAGHDSARVWDALSGRLLFVLHPGGRVFVAQFSPEGTRIATGSTDNTARIWDAKTGGPLGVPLQHHAEVYALRFSADGHRLATGSGDQTARIWDAHTGQPLTQPLKHNDFVSAVQFSPDQMRLLTASWDGTARLWDVATGLPVSEPFRHEAGLHSACFSPDGRRVATASQDKSARIWEIALAPVPMPAWIPQLAEAVSGQRVNSQGVLEPVAAEEFFRLKEQCERSVSSDAYSRWAQWFFADRATRAAAPASQ